MYKFNLAFRLFNGAIKAYSVKAASMEDAISKGVAKVRKACLDATGQVRVSRSTPFYHDFGEWTVSI